MSSTLGWTRAAALLVALTASGCSVPRWPVHGRLTSPFGLRGFWPEVHRGVDVSVPDGTPVQAMKAGVVEFAGTLSGYGNVVVLRHGNNLETVYAHLSEIRVRRGERVAGRQVIALSGHSGNATGPHLHFEVRRWGRPEDPVPLLGGGPR